MQDAGLKFCLAGAVTGGPEVQPDVAGPGLTACQRTAEGRIYNPPCVVMFLKLNQTVQNAAATLWGGMVLADAILMAVNSRGPRHGQNQIQRALLVQRRFLQTNCQDHTCGKNRRAAGRGAAGSVSVLAGSGLYHRPNPDCGRRRQRGVVPAST